MASTPRGGRQSSDGNSVPPEKVANIPTPPADLSGYKNSIAYNLGELTTNVQHLAKDIDRHGRRVDKLSDSTEANFRDLKTSVKKIEDDMLVARTQVKSAFYTSKLFLIAVSGVSGWLIANFSWIQKLIAGRG